MTAAIRTVGVVGTGVIGASWTALFLARGLKVIVSDPVPQARTKLKAYIEKEWPTLEQIGLSPGARQDNFEFVENVADHLDLIDFVQENGPEQIDFKTKMFSRLDAEAGSEVILASSSSGMPSSSFISGCKRYPERVIIGHPFNPPHLVPLVEVVPHPKTDAVAIQRTLDFYKALGKTPILVRQECPGFVANRLQAALNMEAYSLVQRGVISASGVDAAVTTGLGLRWALTGPIITSVLGGGGGPDGIAHLLHHLGPGITAWMKDMDKHRFKINAATIDNLRAKVSEYVNDADLDELEKERDQALLALIDLKRKANELT